jgi:hypothetical protein
MASPRRPSGNAGKGRPKGSPNRATRRLKELASRYTAQAVETAAAIMQDEHARSADRLKAIEILLDRGHGRPRQQIDEEADPDDRGAVPVVVVLPDNGR